MTGPGGPDGGVQAGGRPGPDPGRGQPGAGRVGLRPGGRRPESRDEAVPGPAAAAGPVRGEREEKPGHRPRIDPRFAERWVQVRREQGRHRLRLLLVALSLVVVVGLAVGSLYSPLLNVRHIRIAAPPSLPRQQLLAVAGLVQARPLIDIDAHQVAARLDAVPTLGAARVRKQWPATLNISVTARTPIAVVAGAVPARALPLAPATVRPGWVTVDATGRVLADVQAAPGFPVLQGAGPVPAPGAWLTGSAGPGAIPPAGAGGPSLVDLAAAPDSPSVPGGTAAALAIVAALPPSLRPHVLSVTVAPGNVLRMAVLPTAGASATIAVNIGDGSQLADKLTALATLLLQANLAGVAQIDLSVPDRPATLTARQTPGTVSTHAGG